jgi:hypothetical protein
MQNFHPFVQTTAKDYAIPVSIVQKYYEQYGSTLYFYEKLEDFLRERGSNFNKF